MLSIVLDIAGGIAFTVAAFLLGGAPAALIVAGVFFLLEGFAVDMDRRAAGRPVPVSAGRKVRRLRSVASQEPLTNEQLARQGR